MLLTGHAAAGLWDHLAAQVIGHGYTVQRGDCSGANGYTDPATGTVRVRADVDDAQAVRTLAHELGHIECGHVADLPTYATCRGRCEVEAESVAYIVTAAAGMDAAGYTFAYVAHWAGGTWPPSARPPKPSPRLPAASCGSSTTRPPTRTRQPPPSRGAGVPGRLAASGGALPRLARASAGPSAVKGRAGPAAFRCSSSGSDSGQSLPQ